MKQDTEVPTSSTSESGDHASDSQKHSGPEFLQALKYLLFPNTFAALPNEVRSKLEDPTRLLSFDQFSTFLHDHLFPSFCESMVQKTYCRSWDDMMKDISIIIHSLSPNIATPSGSLPTYVLQYIAPMDVIEQSENEQLRNSFLFEESVMVMLKGYAKMSGNPEDSVKVKGKKPKKDERRFKYRNYYEFETMFDQLPGMKNVPKQLISTSMYGYYTCPPIKSPSDVPCKPAHFIVRDLFNFLNYEMNIFRSIREEFKFDLMRYISTFFEGFNITENAQFCISIDAFNTCLEKGRAELPRIMNEEVGEMYVPTNEDLETHGIEYIVSKLKLNNTCGLFEEGYKLAIDIVESYLATKPKNIDWLKLADEALYRSFFIAFPDFCVMAHNQKQCDQWGFCMLKMTLQHTKHTKFCNPPQRAGVFGDFLSRHLNNELKKRQKTSRKRKERSTSSQAVPKKVETFVPAVTYIYTFRTCPIPETKVDVVLFNTNIIKTCLKNILDDITYQSVVARKIFKESERKEWFEWSKGMEVMDRVKNFIPNFDSVLSHIRLLRVSDGSAMLFKTGGCIDWQNPNVVLRSSERLKTHDLKQNWLKALPIFDYFYPNESDKILFKILVEYVLDQLASSIGTSEIVTLKCPQDDLHNLMRDVKLKIRTEKSKMDDVLVEILKKDDGMDEQMMSQLKEFVFGSSADYFAEEFESILGKLLKDCHDDIAMKKELAKNVVYKIHKAQMIRKTLCEVDKFGITRKYDVKEMEYVPTIRTVRNDTMVFEEEYRLGFDVANILKDENHEPVTEDQNDTIRTFNYVLKNDIQDISRSEGFEEVPFNMVSLENNDSIIKAPILSPAYTLCIEASTTLEDVLNILREKRIFERLDANNINTLTIFIDDLMEYFKPEKSSTFCLDYDKSMELLEITRKKFENFSTETVRPGKKNSTGSSPDKIILPIFDSMLSSISGNNLSKKDKEELTNVAGTRSLLYEYQELGIAYHNQGMCCQTGKLAYCPIDYFDKDDKNDYDLPEPCNFTCTNTIDSFNQKMEELQIRRLEKCVVENSKNKLKRSKKMMDHEMESRKVLHGFKEPGVSTSTQTETVLELDSTFQNEMSLLRRDVQRMELDIFDYKKDITKLKALQSASLNKERNMNHEIGQLRTTMAENRKTIEKNRKEADESMERQKKLTEHWRMKYQSEEKNNRPSTSTASNATVRNTVTSYLCHIGEASDLLEAARQKLAAFLTLSTVDSDKKRAEIEFGNFEISIELSIKKTQRNLALLEADANVDSDLLFKIESCPKPFSQVIFAKMLSAEEAKEREENPECGICLVILKIGDDLFHCPIIVNGRQCGYTMHLDCFEKWMKTNSKCPQCGRVVVDPTQYPLP